MNRYESHGTTVFLRFPDGTRLARAHCADAARAAAMLNRARVLNDEKRKYTAACCV